VFDDSCLAYILVSLEELILCS